MPPSPPSTDLFALVASAPLPTLLEALALPGADVAARDYDRRTLLHVAATTGRRELVEALVERGADVNALDRWGRSPADDAVVSNQPACAAYLKSIGAKSLKPRMMKQVSFMPARGSVHEFLSACANHDLATINRLASVDSFNVNAMDSDKRTGAHVAASEGHLDVLLRLHELGADFNSADRWGNRSLDDALRGGHDLCIALLKSHGAVPSSRPRQLETLNEEEVNVDDDRPTMGGKHLPLTLSEVSEDALLELQRRGMREFWCWKASDIKMELQPFTVGAGGEVYYAQFRSLHCVAKSCGRLDATAIHELGTEISLMASIRHPNIALFFGACFEVSPPVMLLEFCDRGTLENRIVAAWASDALPAHRLLPAQLLRMAHEIAQGMTFLHEFPIPIIHRDLTPSNILLCGQAETIKLVDFGLAKYLPQKSNISNLKLDIQTATGNDVETSKHTELVELHPSSFRFMAPELFRREPYDTSIDVYSYALVVHFMFSGHLPFHFVPDPKEAARLASAENRRPETTSLRICEKDVAPLLEKCWAVDPNDRIKFSQVCSELELIRAKMLRGGSSLSSIVAALGNLFTSGSGRSPKPPSSASPSKAPARDPSVFSTEAGGSVRGGAQSNVAPPPSMVCCSAFTSRDASVPLAKR